MGRMSLPESSIIIVTYNGWHETTAPCLDSILRLTGNETYEIIVVDNHSTDGTPAYLTDLAGREPRLRCVLNAVNRGFAGGNNDGIRAASGKILVLLNSDTRVSEGWLAGLRTALQEDVSIGLVGPVSNAVGNEQRIFTGGVTPSEILAEGAAWVRHSRGDAFETERLGFFCVAFRRETMEAIGLLDEAYGLGFYEDDDYCLRVRQAGYRLVCREDIFVYHRGGSSFGKERRTTRSLLRKNRRRLERKFGIRYAPRHPRDRQLDLVESYLRGHNRAGSEDAVRFKAENRIRIAGELMPRGFFKRRRFASRLHAVLVQFQELP
jgi:GT2 family glycosyltransferase